MKIINNTIQVTDLLQSYGKDEKDIVIIGPSPFNELDCLKETKIIDKVQLNLEEVFSFVKNNSVALMKKRRGTIAFLLNPQSFEGGNNIYSPIYNSAIKSFLKSLSKEMNPFRVKVMGIILPLTQDTKSTRKYDLVTLKYKGINNEKQVQDILSLLKLSEILNGQIVSLGAELNL
ncbi:hypothetical protein [Limosilactobacillus reuteri]|uniref:hypothetical protein n=1 Tax=Limosilactobacillus reuteri TaxID=1598 RepID=UPI001E2E6603|nr:hypothetical protein [Limosilactobacillus reuteri]UFK69237.1 hypothetical protein IVR12_02348 [Limosilactobacillus reuteri]